MGFGGGWWSQRVVRRRTSTERDRETIEDDVYMVIYDVILYRKVIVETWCMIYMIFRKLMSHIYDIIYEISRLCSSVTCSRPIYELL